MVLESTQGRLELRPLAFLVLFSVLLLHVQSGIRVAFAYYPY
jgi:hypothetical protein